MVKAKRAAPAGTGRPKIKSLDAIRYEPERNANQSPIEELLANLNRMADWAESLRLRIDRRRDYLEIMNAFAGYDDLAMEVRDFNAACNSLISKKRRVA